MKTSLTVDQLLKELKTVKKQVGGNAEVFVCVPWPDGVGAHDEPIINAHCTDKDAFIAIKDTSR